MDAISIMLSIPFPQLVPTISAPDLTNSTAACLGVTPIIVKYPLGPLSKVIVDITVRLVFSLAALMAMDASSRAVIVSITTPSAPPFSKEVT